MHYDLVGGVPKFKPNILNARAPVNTQLWDAGAQIPIGFVQDYEYERQWTDAIALAGITSYEAGNYLIDDFPGVNLAGPERRLVDRRWPAILSHMLERQQAWILGARDVDKDWLEYQARLEKLGLSRVLAVMQSAWERQGK